MERMGELSAGSRPLPVGQAGAVPRIIDRLNRLLGVARRRSDADIDIYREHPGLLFANDREIARYAAEWRSYDLERHIPVSSMLLRKW